MAELFWDTSALVKHYHPELGTPKVDNLLQAQGSRHVISRLAVTETFSVFAGKVRAGLVTLVEFDQLCRRFLADSRRKLFSVARLLVAHHREAERLLRLYGPQAGQGLRTLDSLQLAVALNLRSRGAVDTVVCADARLLAVAQAEGLPVIDPEQP
ncbi:MAG TPA: type II toxin-antitoxin system VapC family toxin [Gemmataceae bacterium]|nr:type II toxin-antitoxin system VapC family toxin [Gemmataceae bacterium]